MATQETIIRENLEIAGVITPEPKKIRILNLGAGVGSAPLVGMQLDGELDYDVAIFSDTQDEPSWVYRQVEWLEKQVAERGGNPIVRVTAGDLMANLRRGKNNDGGRFVSIPAFTKLDSGEVAMTRRQCTREYKIEPIEHYTRYTLLGLSKGQRIPTGTEIVQLFGFSTDEAHRAARMRKQQSSVWKFEFPMLHEDILMTKGHCRKYMAAWCTEFEWLWSSCRSCPYHSDIQWRELQQNSPPDFEAACVNDDALRDPGNVVNRNMDNPMYIHRSCKPLREVDFTKGGQQELFQLVCDGGCLT